MSENGRIQSAVLLISCPDRKGLVASVTEFIFQHDGNILHLDQHVDAQQGVFFMRVEWDLAGFRIPAHEIAPTFRPIADRFAMAWDLHFTQNIQRMAIFVSKQDHCLYDLLARWQSGDLKVDIPLIVSNHPDLGRIAANFGIAFHTFAVTKDNKAAQERAQRDLLEAHSIDVIVLARYMQILGPDFVAAYPNRIINIHHSFLPAFPGAKPYHQAYERGVKIIGATSHFVTAELDAGPIIEQDVARVDHRDSVQEMIRKGKDLEKTVLARAIWSYAQHRILVYHNKTVVFK